jgi:hypothetical protein
MSQMARCIWLPLVAAAVLLGVTSCSASAGDLHVNSRTLLIYPAGNATADAALTGVLHTNAAGCLAVGTDVLVAPSGSSLSSDGSIVVHGTTYKLGTRVLMGGGGGTSPKHTDCGAHLRYFYV